MSHNDGATGNSRQLCTFILGDYLFGVDVIKVQEVIRYQGMTAVPLASSVIRGLINLRGQIVTAVDMRIRLGLGERPTEALPMNVVVRTPEGAVSLLVDEIGDVLEVDEAAFERGPETMTPTFRELVRGVYKLEKRLLLLLDTDRAVNLPGGGARAKCEAA